MRSSCTDHSVAIHLLRASVASAARTRTNPDPFACRDAEQFLGALHVRLFGLFSFVERAALRQQLGQLVSLFDRQPLSDEPGALQTLAYTLYLTATDALGQRSTQKLRLMVRPGA
jgi:hypothetical protein